MKYEWKKVFTRGMLLLFLLCMVGNASLFYSNQSIWISVAFEGDYNAYLEALEELQNHPDMVLEPPAEGELLSPIQVQLQEQQATVQSYPQYILGMPERAENAALLSGKNADAYSLRNIEKTTRDFAGLETLPVRVDRDTALLDLYQFPLSDILVLVFLLFVCVRLFSREYEQGLYPLLLATPGRFRVACHKLAVLAGSTLLITVGIYGANLCIGGVLMGYGDLSRPVQSMGAFLTCCLRISCLDYIWMGFLMKLFMAFLFGLLVLTLFVLLKKAVTVFLVCAAFLGISYGFYAAIPITSSLNPLRFVNFFYLMDSFSVLSRYQNISVVGFPVSMTTVLPVVVAVLLVFCIPIILCRFSSGSVCRGVRLPALVGKVLDRGQRLADSIHHHRFLFLHELRKTMVSGRGLLLLLLLGLLLWNNWDSAFRLHSGYEQAYTQYIQEMGGKITDQTLQKIAEEWEYLNQVEEPQFYQNQMEALANIENQVNTAISREEQTGIPAYLVDESGYLKLMQDSGADTYDTLLVLAGVILCCCGIFARENTFGTRKMLRICPNGNRLRLDKLLLSVLLSVVIAAGVYGARLAIVCKDYLLQYAEAPVQSIMVFQNYPYRLTLLQYLLWLFALRLLGALIAGLMVAAVSAVSRSDSVAMALGAAVLIVPAVAVGMGASILQSISLYPLLGGNAMMQAPFYFQMIYAVFGLLFAVGSIFLVRRRWSHQG